MLLFASILLFLIVAASIVAFGYVRFVKPVSMLEQLATSTAEAVYAPQSSFETTPATGMAKWLGSLGRIIPHSPQDLAIKKRELVAAGFRSPHAVYILIGLQLITCAVLAVLALTLRNHITSNPLNRLIFPIIGAVGGYLLPGSVLGRLVKRRRLQIRLALPDVLDLLVISTEAGCALDKAILNVSREFKTFHPAISEELSLVNVEMLAGGSRIDALRNFATRTGEDELKKLVAILIQTDRFGTSVAEALRTQSEFMRVRRRQEAEERAGKVGVKLVFPIFFFCMPALTILVAGPGFLQLFKALPTLAGPH
jgi:tight adherence protein C